MSYLSATSSSSASAALSSALSPYTSRRLINNTSPTAVNKYLTRGRYEVPALMPRDTSRSLTKSSYAPRTSRSASASRSGMASSGSSARTSYGSGTGSSYSSSTGTGTGSYSSYSSGVYSPRSSTSNYYGGSSSSGLGSSNYSSSSTSSTYTPSYSSSSYTPRTSSYYTSGASSGTTTTTTPLSPRAKSPDKEKTADESKTSETDTTTTSSWRSRHRTTSKSDSDESSKQEMRLPSLNEQGANQTMSKDLRECLREEFLLCKICFDVFKNPKSLPCLHTFCLECLNKYIEGQRLDYRKFSCPICRRQVYMPQEGAQGFPDSFFVERLHDVLSRRTDDTNCHICNFKGQPRMANMFCLECKTNLCADCGNGHRESKVTSKHSLLVLDDGSEALTKPRVHCCSTHSGEPVCFFCIECRRPICLACTVMDHAGHSVEAIQSVRQEFIQDCQGYMKKAESELTDLQTKRGKLGQIEKGVIDKKDAVKSEVCAVADGLIEQINKQKATILGELDQLFDFENIESERKRMDSTISTLQTAVDAGRAVLSKDLEPIEQLKSKGQVLSDLDGALHFDPYNVDSFSDRSSLAVQFLSGESEVRLGRLVRTIMPTDGSANTDPIIEYKLADAAESTIQTAGGCQTFIVKDDVRKQLRSIDALALLATGELVVLSATSERRVQIFDMAGMLKSSFPQRPNKLQQPSSLCVWENQIAITDLVTKAVHVFDSQGRLSHVFGTGVLDKPWAITASSSGYFIIADPGKSRLTVHTNNGDLMNVVYFQKKSSVPRFLATCGNTIYSAGQFGDEMKAWRFADCNIRLLGLIKVSPNAAAANSLLASSSALGSAASSQSSGPKTSTSSTSTETVDEVARSRSGSISLATTNFNCAGLFADKEGNLFVTDRSTSSVVVFTALSEAYMIQLSTASPIRPSSVVVTADDRIIVAQSKADDTISGLVEAITGDALNMELVSYSLV